MNSKYFPSLIKLEKEDTSLQNLIKLTDMNMFKTIEYSLNEIVEKIRKIDNISDEEIYRLLKYQHNMILNYDLFLKDRNTREDTQRLFTNKKFLNILRNCIASLNLTSHEMICMNKIIYDYLILEDKDESILEMLLDVSYQVNNRLSLILSSKMGINRARIACILVNSSFKPEKNIHRLNAFLVKSDMELTTQDVVDIYCMIFDRFTYPIIYTLLESKPSNLSQRELNNFDAISLAIITLLNHMTMIDLEKVLSEYGYLVNLLGDHISVRFSLKSINSDRIQSVISNLTYNSFGDIIIP